MDVNVDTVAPCKKKLSITIPREEIDKKLDERFMELTREAEVPGFRPGRAPRRLVEKRFREAVAEEVRAKLVAEGFEKAVKDQELDIIGEPEVDPDAIEMPDDGPMTFSIELEVRPEFQLPDSYAGIPLDEVKRPEVTDASVAQALERLREQHGTIEPVGPDADILANDLVTCDLTLQAGDVMVLDRQNVRLPVAAIAQEGIRLDALPDLLKGAKVGQTKTAKMTIGQEADKEDVRGKEAELTVKIDSASRVALPDDAALLAAVDYEDIDSLKAAVRRQQDSQNDAAYQRAQEDAVKDWLLAQMPFELPEELAKRHANRVLQRQLVNLQYRGVPAQEIEKRIDQIQSATTEQAARDLKLFFILDALAKKENIEATDAEVDARVRFIAAQYGRREDRVRDDMSERGGLDSLRSQILEDKALRLLLEKARGGDTPQAPAPEAPKAEGEPQPQAEGEPQAQPETAQAETPKEPQPDAQPDAGDPPAGPAQAT